ncbi:MAG TPA: RidA family protein [Xanthobacteraceae bacterium]|jgi:enamine deaminase RidA (YjgF/YER057c/UK114 family)|nr:RidA family protein [Xanthobacteraceae bacterium]
MSARPDLGPQEMATVHDDLSRRRLVTGAAIVAALGGMTTETLAQAPGGTPGNLRFLNPPTSFKNPGFNHAVEAIGPGRIVYIAGQQGRDIDNKIVGAPGDFRAQAEQAFLNIKGALGAAGGGFEHVVKLCHYFIDLQAHFRMMRDIRLKYFDPARMPASTMIQVGALTDEKAIYEVDVVAVLPPA